MNKVITTSILFLALISSSQFLKAQVTADDRLYKEIMKNDSLLFEAGFNNCELSALHQVTDSDFEFYHDQSGTTFGQERFIEEIRKNICSLDYRPQRRLLEGSTRIYPLKNNGALYGAIQEGIHAFYALEKNKEPYLTSMARFTF